MLKEVKSVEKVIRQEETIDGGGGAVEWVCQKTLRSFPVSLWLKARQVHAQSETTLVLSNRTYYNVENKTDILDMKLCW